MPHTNLSYIPSRMERREQQTKHRRRVILLILCCIFSFLAGFFFHNQFCEPEVIVEERVCNIELVKEIPVYTLSSSITTGSSPEAPVVVPSTKVSTEPEEEPVSEEEVFQSFYNYTTEELDLLSRLIEAEVGAESYEAKLRVGSVVMNRVMATNFPNTIREVIYQKNQFSVTFLRVNGVIMIDRPASEESIRAAKEILDYGSILPQDVQVFYAVGCTEKWVTSRKVYEVCDKTVFSYIYS